MEFWDFTEEPFRGNFISPLLDSRNCTEVYLLGKNVEIKSLFPCKTIPLSILHFLPLVLRQRLYWLLMLQDLLYHPDELYAELFFVSLSLLSICDEGGWQNDCVMPINRISCKGDNPTESLSLHIDQMTC